MRRKVQLLFVSVFVLTLLTSCASSPEAVLVGEEEGPIAEEVTALLVGDMPFTMSQLESMETLDVEYAGKDSEVTLYTGVLVMDLLADAGASGDTLVFVASDGYEAELAMSELEACADCVVAFDDEELRLVLPGFATNVQVRGVVEITLK